MYVLLFGFLSRYRIIALRFFANNISAVLLLTKEAGIPGSMMALNNEPLDFSVTRRHLILPVAEIIFSEILTTSVRLENSEILRTE